jgi:hypothetical protein
MKNAAMMHTIGNNDGGLRPPNPLPNKRHRPAVAAATRHRSPHDGGIDNGAGHADTEVEE